MINLANVQIVHRDTIVKINLITQVEVTFYNFSLLEQFWNCLWFKGPKKPKQWQSKTCLKGTLSQRWSSTSTFHRIFLCCFEMTQMLLFLLPWGLYSPVTLSVRLYLIYIIATHTSISFTLISFLLSSYKHLTHYKFIYCFLLQPECNNLHKGNSLYLAPMTVPGTWQALDKYLLNKLLNWKDKWMNS